MLGARVLQAGEPRPLIAFHCLLLGPTFSAFTARAGRMENGAWSMEHGAWSMEQEQEHPGRLASMAFAGPFP